MKRYYSIDFTVMAYAKLTATKWMILENIHFLQAETGSCYAKKTKLAEHHGLTYRMYRKYIIDLENNGWLKQLKNGDLKTTKKWIFLQSEDGKKEAENTMNKSSHADKINMNKSSDHYEQKFTSSMNKSSHFTIKKEKEEREKERKKEKEFKFSLKRDTHFDNVSIEYKQKLKAKLLLLCGDEKMIENFFLSLEAKASYKYKNFVTVFKRWHRDLNYTPLPEPQLGKGWFRVSTNGKFYAINEKTLEIKIGSVKETSLQDQEPKQIQKRDLGFLKNTVRRF